MLEWRFPTFGILYFLLLSIVFYNSFVSNEGCKYNNVKGLVKKMNLKCTSSMKLMKSLMEFVFNNVWLVVNPKPMLNLKSSIKVKFTFGFLFPSKPRSIKKTLHPKEWELGQSIHHLQNWSLVELCFVFFLLMKLVSILKVFVPSISFNMIVSIYV